MEELIPLQISREVTMQFRKNQVLGKFCFAQTKKHQSKLKITFRQKQIIRNLPKSHAKSLLGELFVLRVN